MSETGITDFLYNHICSSSIDKNDVRIFKIKSNIESIFGNDLDLFIKIEPNQYKWYVFQAKVMEYTGAFNDLKRKNKNSYPQWTKLKLHESLFDSEPYFLFYCGQPKVKTKQIKGNIQFSDCLGQANYGELGLSAVELNDVISNRKNKGISQLTYFNEFFPNNVRAFRYFFCKKGLNTQSNKYYSLEEIMESNVYEEVNIEDVKATFEENDFDNFEKITVDKGQGKTRIIID